VNKFAGCATIIRQTTLLAGSNLRSNANMRMGAITDPMLSTPRCTPIPVALSWCNDTAGRAGLPDGA